MRLAYYRVPAGGATLAADLALLGRAGVGGALVGLPRSGSAAERRLRRVLSSRRAIRWLIRFGPERRGNPSVRRIRAELATLTDRPGYLRVAGRPVVVVPRGHTDSCAIERRWRRASAARWIVVVEGCGAAIARIEPPAADRLSAWRAAIRGALARRAPFELVPGFARWRSRPDVVAELALDGAPLVAAVGDIACQPGAALPGECRQQQTSDLAIARDYDAALLLGDLQYDSGTLAAYQQAFDPTWGRLRAISYPAPGNHEYVTPGAAGYFAYWGERAGDPTQGWYSTDVGGWHVIALNSNCAAVGGCTPGSPQETWLRADLRSHPAACTLAFWHHPRFSSALHGSDRITQPLYQALEDARADLILVGHEHDYERFAASRADGTVDPSGGIRQIVAGTGGRSLYAFGPPLAGSEVRISTYGLLQLRLRADGYDWTFLREDGSTGDTGTTACH